MLNYFSLFYLLFAISLELQALSINIFGENNGKGLEQSRSILKNALLELGHSVTEVEREAVCVDGTKQVDINIFIETLIPEWFSTAKYNWFIPNPEWYDQPLSFIDDIDLILCRNHNVENLFQHYRNKTYFLGFTS